jgi:hypothetical protein
MKLNTSHFISPFSLLESGGGENLISAGLGHAISNELSSTLALERASGVGCEILCNDLNCLVFEAVCVDE